MDAYQSFLARKAVSDPMTGLADVPSLPDCLFPHQRDIVTGAVTMGRKGIGIELKPSYFAQAKRNLAQAKADMGGLFNAA